MDIKNCNVWADDRLIKIIATLLDINVHVWLVKEKTWIRHNVNEESPTLRVASVKNSHFELIRDVQGQA